MMWGWIPFVMKLFQKLPHRRAAITSIILAWMFLPEYAYVFPGIPNYDKKTATTLAVLIATFIYSSRRIEKLEFDIQDAVVIFWCLTPFFASIANGLGAYDGVAASKNYVTIWLIPYMVGRMYLVDWESVKDLAWGIFFGGLIYAPLCCTEIIMSPQMHMWVYGWHPHDFIQSIRGNSYRPVLFMHHGLMVGMWMASACLCGVTLLSTGQIDQMKPLLKRFKLPPWIKPKFIVIALIGVFVACQSMGALILFMQACGVLYLSRRFKTKLLLFALLLYPSYKMAGAITGFTDPHKAVEFARKISEDRAASLQFRLDNEEILVEKAMQRPIIGWGGWGRSRVRDHTGKDISVTDAYWVIVIGTTGLLGLASFMLIVCGPAWRLLTKFPKDGWSNPQALLIMPLLVLLPMYAQDCLFNDMKNPIFMVIAGGLITMSRVPGFLKLPAMEEQEEEKIKIMGVPSIEGLVTRYV